MTYRVTLNAPAPEMREAVALLMAAEEECARRGWRLHALSWRHGRWHAIVGSSDPWRTVQTGIRRILGKGRPSGAAVQALRRGPGREQAILDMGWKQAAAFYVASA